MKTGTLFFVTLTAMLTALLTVLSVFSVLHAEEPRAGKTPADKLTASKDLYFSEVRQKAVLEVNEEDTEAAAATAMVALSYRGSTPDVIEFLADRPFLYILYDENSEWIMFMGTYVKGR